MAKSQVEIVQNAQLLASTLQGGADRFSKNAFLSVVATFVNDPAGDLERLRRMLALLEKGSGGHLKRGGGFGDQVRIVIQEVGRLLDRNEWQPGELKSLFGWTARLVQVQQENGEPNEEARESREHRQGRPSHPFRDRQTPVSDRREKKSPISPAQPFRGVSSKNLDVLNAWKKKLSDPEGKDS
jgi:hypothetical protein